MTTGRDKPTTTVTVTSNKTILDGFGADVTKDVGATVVMYGVAPYDYPDQPWIPSTPPIIPAPPMPPYVPPRVEFTPRPFGYTLTVTGPDGTVMTLALSDAEWKKVRAAILRATK